MHILIIGAGIAGPLAALSLEAAGFKHITIAERSREIKGLGVGVNLLPHAVRELTELGIAERIEALGTRPHTLSYYNRHGQQIWSEPRGTAAGYQWPQLSVHRGNLQVELNSIVTERLGNDTYRLGHKLVSIEDSTAHFELPDETTVSITADLIVAADGIHSTARAQYYPHEGDPVWSGLTLWRGTAKIPAFLDSTTMVMVGDADQKFVAYPLTARAKDGTQRVNFIAEKRVAGSPNVDWNREVDREPIAELFEGWSYDWLDIPTIIRGSEELLEYPMVDRDTIPQWTFGNLTLLGDAAHAMYPNGSNGGSQATLDARTLAYALATSSTVQEALTQYEADRRPACAKLLELTRQTGPERVMQIAYERAPQGFTHVHDVISQDELEHIANEYKTVAGFHPDMLNARSSLSVQKERP